MIGRRHGKTFVKRLTTSPMHSRVLVADSPGGRALLALTEYHPNSRPQMIFPPEPYARTAPRDKTDLINDLIKFYKEKNPDMAKAVRGWARQHGIPYSE